MKVILEIAEGNPKQLMRLCSEGFIYWGDEGKEINASALVKYFVSKGYIVRLSRTEKLYFKIVERLGTVGAGSIELIDALKKAKIKSFTRQQNRVILERLVDKRYLLKNVTVVNDLRKVQYLPSELSKHVFSKKVAPISK
jgi:hypothetical protein